MKKILVALVVLPFLMMGMVLMVGGSQDPAAACIPSSAAGPVVATATGTQQVGSWKGPQLANAAAIINAGAAMGISRRGQTIGVMTAMGESTLRVLDYGDKAGPDSRGLFQQRTSWGPLAVRMNPTRSATLFFAALQKVEGWTGLPPTIAAHRVQRNADPNHYEKFWDDAQEVVDALTQGQGAAVGTTIQAGTSDRYNLGNVKPQLRALVGALAPRFSITTVGGYRASARDPKGHPSGLAADFMVPKTAAGKNTGDALASFAQRNAAALGIDYIIWNQRIWNHSDTSTRWRPMSDRGSDTENHKDHVHINALATAEVTSGTQNISTNISTECIASASGGVVYPLENAVEIDRRNWRADGGSWSKWHTGTDFSTSCGTPVIAAHGGTVSIESSSWAGPQLVKVSTGPNSLTTWYAHMESVTVAAGAIVLAGQQIGTVGDLGNSTGCHLHFEVHLKNGSIYGDDNTNPTTWLAENVGRTLVGAAAPAGSYRVASFNALGHSHTRRGGNRPGWPDAGSRTLQAIREVEAAGIEIVGLQEFQPYQSRTWLSSTAGQWALFPRPESGLDNVVAWRTASWVALRKETIPIPYFGGHTKRMPYVLLQHRATGAKVWVGSFHNPADVGGKNDRWRARATAMEAQLATRLHAQGVPVLFTGDMNAREGYFCPTVRSSPLRSASGGTVKPCKIGPNQGIDFVMGAGVAFSGYTADWSIKDRRISDHPLVSAVASLSSTNAARPVSTVPAGRIRVVQANVPNRAGRAKFISNRDRIAAMGPDFITFNEVWGRSNNDLTPAGYDTWRDNPVKPVTESRGTAVVWRTDRWTPISRGRVRITTSPCRLDNRWATWVLLQDAAGKRISVVSGHMMVNPTRSARCGTQDRRENYRLGMEVFNSVFRQLQQYGPVLLGGDLNSQYRANGGNGDPWGPQAVLAGSGMRSTYSILGPLAGLHVDYLMFSPGLTPTGHRGFQIPGSDHNGLLVDLTQTSG